MFYMISDRPWTCNCGTQNRQGSTHCAKCKIAWQDAVNASYRMPQHRQKRHADRLRRMRT